MIGSLLGFYFGLRISEICNLRIGHILLGNSPTIYIHKSKGGSSRFIEGIEIPRSVINCIADYRNERLTSNQGNLNDLLLVDMRGKSISRQYISRHWSEAVKATNLNKSHEKFHTLRHACANRWMALGVSLLDIARKLGHRSVDTSVQTYIHCFHFLQKEQMEAHCMLQEPLQFTSKGIASLIGVTQRRVRQLLSDKQMTYSNIRGKRYYASQVVLELKSNYLTQLEEGST